MSNTAAQRNQIIGMHNTGASLAAIGRNKSSVNKVMRKYEVDGSVDNIPGHGRREKHRTKRIKRYTNGMKMIPFLTRKTRQSDLSIERGVCCYNPKADSCSNPLNMTSNQGRLREQVDGLQQNLKETANTLHEQKGLITQLEEDLRNVNALSSLFRGDAEGEPGPSDPSVEAMADIVKVIKMPSPASLETSGGSKSAADSLLPIVQSQRERYRQRAQELEAQTLSQQQQINLIQNEMDKLRSDNVKLYEKIRFLQSYPTRGNQGDDVASSYSSQYENNLDPFTSFNRKERQRRYLELKPYDKITLSMGRLIMGNKTARVFAFFYTVILHMLVFLVLYKLAHTESCKRDMAADWHEKYAEHMLKVHGGPPGGHGDHVH